MLLKYRESVECFEFLTMKLFCLRKSFIIVDNIVFRERFLGREDSRFGKRARDNHRDNEFEFLKF